MINRKASGFTLLEITVVLIIVALVTGMGMVATMGALESARRTATENKLSEIEKALMAFRSIHNRLPCPAQIDLASSSTNSGVESANTGSCEDGTPEANIWDKYWNPASPNTHRADKVAEGGVPVKALGLPNEFMYDGWGRKITYLVMVAYTSLDAFKAIHPQENCGMKIYSNDDADEEKNSKAAYVLISHGANGHGAYLRGGSRMGANSTNVAEQTNCRCSATLVADSSMTGAVQKDYSEDAADANNTFDDIVRYKERWQMQTPDDDKNFRYYAAAQLAVSTITTDDVIYIYQKQCDNFIQASTGGTASMNTSYVGFSTDNAHLFTYGLTNDCLNYPISGTTLGTSVATDNCPAFNSTNAVAMSANGFLAITNTTAPYLRMWRYSGSSFVYMNTSFAAALASKPTKIAISPIADQLLLANSGSWSAVYRRKEDNELLALATQPTGLPTTINSAVYSPDGRYLAVADNSNNLYIWRITVTTGTPITYTAVSAVDNVSGDVLNDGFTGISHIAFSPDSQYIALTTSATGVGDASGFASLLKIYKLDTDAGGTTESFSAVTISGSLASGYTTTNGIIGLAFTPDSQYLVVQEGLTHLRALMNFKKQGTLSFKYTGNTDSPPSVGVPKAISMYR